MFWQAHSAAPCTGRSPARVLATYRGRVLRPIRIGALVLGGVFVPLQLVPYGRNHDNPPVTSTRRGAPRRPGGWPGPPATTATSNETHWPWYSNVVPMSWLVQRDVDRGRAVVNFSKWDREQGAADDLRDAVEDGTMPPSNYLVLHPDAELSSAEKAALGAAL